MRKLGLTSLGTVLVAAGLAMLVLPGPGVAVVAVGLAVLASAGVVWAARLLVRTRQRLPKPEDVDGDGLLHQAVSRIDDAMGDLDAVQEVEEQDRLAREERFVENLVTTHDEELDGTAAGDALRQRVIHESGQPPVAR